MTTGVFSSLGLVPPGSSLFTLFCVVSGSNARKREAIFKVQSRNGRYWGGGGQGRRHDGHAGSWRAPRAAAQAGQQAKRGL